jgi:hypothetical protein
MTKKIVQDIVPNERRSIRRLNVEDEEIRPKITRKRSQPIIDEEETEIIQPLQNRKTKVKRDTKNHRNLIMFVVILASVVIIGVALSLLYSKAVVTITQKVVNFNVDGTFIAKKDAIGDDLSYSSITVSDSSTQSISATKGALIQTKAKGVVNVYNNYSSSPQTLVAGTRVATSDGLIFRTTSTISIPGKKTTPGVISVGIVAEKAGVEYNLKASENKGNMNIPGYKGSPKYEGFYARLKNDTVGGYSGYKMSINDQAKKDAVKAIQDSLKIQLVTKLNQNVPKDFILYNSSYNIDFETSEPVMKGTSSAEITVKGIAYGAIFNNKVLVRYIAGREISKFPSDTYLIDGDKTLAFNISNTKDFSVKKGTPLIFTLKGPIKITGIFDETKLKNELKGIRLQDSNSVFAKYPSISNAYALITPFWLRSFPSNPEKINIEYKH